MEEEEARGYFLDELGCEVKKGQRGSFVLCEMVRTHEINTESSTEPSPRCESHDKGDLLVGLGVELEDGPRSAREGTKEVGEEAEEALGRGVGCRVGVAEPLEDGDAVEGAWRVS